MSRRTFWDEPRPANVLKCAECGERVNSPDDIVPGVHCKRCGAALHCCRNCTYFDTAAGGMPARARIVPEKKEIWLALTPGTFYVLKIAEGSALATILDQE